MADPVIIQQGSDIPLVFRLQSRTTMDPIDISAASEIEAIFHNADGTCLHKTLTGGGIVVINGPIGKFQANITEAEGLLLESTDQTDADTILESLQSVEVNTTILGKKQTINFPKSLNVVPRQFPDC